MDESKRYKTTIYLPEDLWKAVKIEAINRGVNAGDLVETALKQFLGKAPKKEAEKNRRKEQRP